MNAFRLLPFCLICLTELVLAAPPLPRVLVLADNIYGEPTKLTASKYKGRVEIVWKKTGDTSTVLTTLEELVGDGKWDLIYFNFGLSDLHYKDPSTKSIRAMSKHVGGVRVTPLEQYEQNLRSIVKRLQTTNAKLVWASTPPIGETAAGLFESGSEILYNEIAAKVMTEHRVAINDLHALVNEKRDPKRPMSGDPFSVDRNLVQILLQAAIRQEFELPVEQ